MRIHCGVWKHIENQKLYCLMSIGRNKKTLELEAHYMQLYDSIMRGTKNDGMKLPYGTIWNRELDEFLAKFQLVQPGTKHLEYDCVNKCLLLDPETKAT
jgi:hypothetical protein